MAPHVVALITVASEPYPCRRIQKVRKTLLRTSGRVYRALAFDALHHGKFTCHVLRELSNFCCLPGRAGGSPNGLEDEPCGNLTDARGVCAGHITELRAEEIAVNPPKLGMVKGVEELPAELQRHRFRQPEIFD